MKIQAIQFYNWQNSTLQNNKVNANNFCSDKPMVDYRPAYYKPVFGSAADLNLQYILKKHSKELPVSMQKMLEKLCELDSQKMPTFREVHDYVYKPLQDAKSLDEIRKYPEFKDVIDLKDYKSNHSKTIKNIKDKMPLEGFTLDFIQKLYTPSTMEDLVKFYGVSNRNSLTYLAECLGIHKLSKTYLQLYKLSDEVENARFAKQAQSYVRTPEARAKCNERAAAAHRTPEYRAKKRQEMKDFYKRNPQVAAKTSKISKLTWDNCPEVKAAFADYRKHLDPSTKRVLTKGLGGEKLNDFERRVFGATLKEFWESHPNMKKIYQQRRIEVIKSLKDNP